MQCFSISDEVRRVSRNQRTSLKTERRSSDAPSWANRSGQRSTSLDPPLVLCQSTNSNSCKAFRQNVLIDHIGRFAAGHACPPTHRDRLHPNHPQRNRPPTAQGRRAKFAGAETYILSRAIGQEKNRRRPENTRFLSRGEYSCCVRGVVNSRSTITPGVFISS